VGVDATDLTLLEVSGDGRLVAGMRLDGTVPVIDIETGQAAFTVPSTGNRFRALDWSTDGRLLAVTNRESGAEVIRILDRRGREVATVREEAGYGIVSVAFSPDGDRLVTTSFPIDPLASGGGQVVVWDWETGTPEQTLDASAAAAVHSPTGDLIATTADGAQAADVWDLATGQHLVTLEGHTGFVNDLTFSADGSQIATASADGTVRVWDAHTGEQLIVLRGHLGLVSDVSFNRDGSQLASTGADGIVRIWALDLDDLIEIAEREVTRTLTDEECRQYLHIPRCP
jgi:WD40 repeat protein